tara:strand:- start:367 stop:540 length:174 start_codon:yes stop_codon:yes gene_type:complete
MCRSRKAKAPSRGPFCTAPDDDVEDDVEPPQAARVSRASGDKLRAVLFLSIAMDTLC